MAITPNTTFTAGAILTAAQQNRFPFGILGLGVSDTKATTTANYTTFATATATVMANRSIKVTVTANVYGYSGNFNVKILEGATEIYSNTCVVAAVAEATPYTYTFVYTPSSAGSKTYEFQLQRIGATNLSQCSVGTRRSQLLIEDIGTA